MNTALIRQRFQAALPHYEYHASAQRQIAEQLVQLLPPRCYRRVLELGCGSGLLTRLLYAKIGDADWFCNDLSANVVAGLDNIFRQPYQFLSGDAVSIPFPDRCDLIAAASCVQWLDDLPYFLQKTAAALNSHGIFLFNTFAPDNLAEIRALTGQGLHYPDTDTWQEWMAPYFTVRAHHAEKIVLYFERAQDVLRHLQKTGVTAAGEYRWTRRKLNIFADAYAERFSSQGKLTLTYAPLYYLLEKKADD